jgi:hypothetical protein
MKKAIRKLTLLRETVRTLTRSELGNLAGGNLPAGNGTNCVDTNPKSGCEPLRADGLDILRGK